MDYEAQIKALREQIEEKDERIKQLENDLGIKYTPPAVLRLTECEAVIMGCMMKRNGVTLEQLYAALYSNKNRYPGPKIVEVYICRLRKKLKAYGLDIETDWGRARYLTEETKTKIRQLWAAA